MMLINGILCLISAIVLLVQIKKTQHTETNQVFQKFMWLYWAILMIIAIHHIFKGYINPWMDGFITALDPITDSMNAVAGLLLALYLAKRRADKEATQLAHDTLR